MAKTKTYAAGEVQVIVGTRALRGKAKGSFVKIARAEDTFKKRVGSDGEVTRSATSDRSGTIEITLEQTSEDNAYLQGLMNADENSKNGIVPSKVIDKLGTYVAVATESWIRKPADVDFGDEAKERTWIIECASLDLLGGGN
jgi:hypothetical protein